MDKRGERGDRKYAMNDFIDYCRKHNLITGEFQVDTNTPYIKELNKEVGEFIKLIEKAQRAAANSKLVFKLNTA